MHRIYTALLTALLLVSSAFGQVAYQLAPVAHQQFFDANGKPLAGGFVYTYSAGSSTPLATYKDNAGTANTNPIVLDAGGFATIYLGQNSYKFCVQNSSAVQQWCQDNVQNISQVLLTTANTWTLGQTFNSLINFLGGTSDTTAAEGNVFYRTDIHRLRLYDGTAWRSLIGADSTDTLTNKTITNPTVTTGTFSSPALTTPSIGGETVSASPRMLAFGFQAGNYTNATGMSSFNPDKAITITRVTATSTATSACTVAPVLQVVQNATTINLTLTTANSFWDSGAISTNLAAGSNVMIGGNGGSSGTCTTNPANLNVLVEYKMQ